MVIIDIRGGVFSALLPRRVGPPSPRLALRATRPPSSRHTSPTWPQARHQTRPHTRQRSSPNLPLTNPQPTLSLRQARPTAQKQKQSPSKSPPTPPRRNSGRDQSGSSPWSGAINTCLIRGLCSINTWPVLLGRERLIRVKYVAYALLIRGLCS